jgi:hypothetical protein
VVLVNVGLWHEPDRLLGTPKVRFEGNSRRKHDHKPSAASRRKMVYRRGCGSAWIDERAFPFCNDDWIEVGATSRIGEGAIRWRIS